MYLCEIDGGNLRNAIAREAHAVIAIPEADKHALRTDLNVFAAQAEAEYAVADPDLQFTLESENPRTKAIDKDTDQASVTSPLCSSARSICHESGYSGPGRNIHQPGIRKNETGQYHPHRNQPAQLYRIFQTGHRHYGTHRIRNGRGKRFLRRRLSGLEAQSSLGNSGSRSRRHTNGCSV